MFFELIFCIFINFIVLSEKLIINFINSKIIFNIKKIKIIMIIIDFVAFLLLLFFNINKFSRSIIIPHSLYDVFLIFFCQAFYLSVKGFLSLIFKKHFSTEKKDNIFVIFTDFCDFLIILFSFYILQIDYLVNDFFILLFLMIVNFLQIMLNSKLSKNISFYKIFLQLLSNFYALFVFIGTNNIIFCLIFYFLINVNRIPQNNKIKIA